jgi:hypothetical protein
MRITQARMSIKTITAKGRGGVPLDGSYIQCSRERLLKQTLCMYIYKKERTLQHFCRIFLRGFEFRVSKEAAAAAERRRARHIFEKQCVNTLNVLTPPQMC